MLKKSLLYKEWMRMKILAILFVLVIFMYHIYPLFTWFLHTLNPDLNIGLDPLIYYRIAKDPLSAIANIGYMSSIPFFALAITGLVAFIFYDLRHHNSQFVLTLPYSKKEILFNKMFIGSMIINVSLIITFIGANILFWYFESKVTGFLYYPYNPYILLLKWLLINVLIYNALFSLEFLLFTIISNVLVSSIISLLLLKLQTMIIPLIIILSDIITDFKRPQIINYISDNQYNIFFMYFGRISSESFGELGNSGSVSSAVFEHYSLKIIILITIIFIATFVSFYLFNKNKFEYNGNALMFGWVNYIFKIVFAISLGSILTLFTHSNIPGTILLFVLLIYIIISYYISHKLIDITSK